MVNSLERFELKSSENLGWDPEETNLGEELKILDETKNCKDRETKNDFEKEYQGPTIIDGWKNG